MWRLSASLVSIVIAVAGCTTQGSPSSQTATSTDPAPTPTATPLPEPTPTSIPFKGPWTATGDMITGRAEHTATVLHDGRVLVAGGVADNREEERLASAELYDPATGTWQATGSMTKPRSWHTATLLPDGRVLVAGGRCDGRYAEGCAAKDPTGAQASAEIYDPSTGTWTPTGDMTTPRSMHTATLLPNGQVLVAGTELAPDRILASAELFDPATGRWTATGDMTIARTQQMATLLRDGTVLVAGGIGPISPTEHGELTSAELYTPGTGTWAATGNMASARSNDPLIVLTDGTVLKTGGVNGEQLLPSCELYDPSTRTWGPTGSMASARGVLTSTLLADGRVLVAAGFGVPTASAELYDPATGSWADAGSFGESRFEHRAVLLLNGKVLVMGGLLEHDVASAAALYAPAPGS